MDDAHGEALGALGDRLADAAVADKAERGTVDVLTEVAVELPLLVAALAQIALGVRENSGRGKDQRKSEVCGRLGEHAGRVANGDPGAGGGFHVDVVEAD